jgi:hypothetical protein
MKYILNLRVINLTVTGCWFLVTGDDFFLPGYRLTSNKQQAAGNLSLYI